MFNTNTFHGADGVLTLSDPDADALDVDEFTNYFGEDGLVGRVTNVTLSVSTEIKAFRGIDVSGTVERAFINGAMLKLMLGKYAEGEETEPFKMPSFNMKIGLDNLRPPGDEGNSILTVYNVMFNSWQFNLPEDDFVLERLSFRARRITLTDTEVPA